MEDETITPDELPRTGAPVVDEDYRMYGFLPGGAKRTRVVKNKIPLPLPPDFAAAEEYTWNYQGTFNKLAYGPDDKWADWREPAVANGTDPSPPRAPELFNVGAAKVPHHDPEELINPRAPTNEQKKAARDERRRQVEALGEHQVKQNEAAESSVWRAAFGSCGLGVQRETQ